MRGPFQRRALVAGLTGLVLPAAAALLLLLLLPRQYPQLLEVDEGYNAMKALLHMQGYAFYGDFWCDHPPLLYFLLDGWFSLWGATLLHGRLFTLVFSTALLTGFYHLVRLENGRFTALLAAIFLFTSWKYAQLSLSLMEVVPALALGTLALLCASAHARRPRWHFLPGAAAFAVLGLYSRLIVGLFLVLVALRWWLARRDSSGTAPPLARTLGWLAGFAICFLAAGAYLLRPIDWRQLLGPHVAAFNFADAAEYAGWRMVPSFLLKDYHLTVLALAGLYVAWRHRSAGDRFAALWLGLTLALMAVYRPVWWHYQILLALPLSWLAARGVAGFLAGHYGVPPDALFLASARLRLLLVVTCLLIVGWLLPSRFVQTYDFLRQPGFDMNHSLLASMKPFAAQTRWVVADDGFQAYPFHLGLPVPPELAVTAPKRIAAGKLEPNDWFAALEKYAPEQAVFSYQFPFPDAMAAYLADRYHVLEPTPVLRHYVRKDLATSAWIARRQQQLLILAHFNAFLRSEPANDRARWQLGIELGKQGAAADAAEWFRAAIRLDSAFFEAHNSLAWLLATHPEPEIRRPAEAIHHAETACALTHRRHPILLDTLGAAYASAGRFPDAIAAAEKARAIADQAGAAPIVAVIDRHLEFYRNNQPYRDGLFAVPSPAEETR